MLLWVFLWKEWVRVQRSHSSLARAWANWSRTYSSLTQMFSNRGSLAAVKQRHFVQVHNAIGDENLFMQQSDARYSPAVSHEWCNGAARKIREFGFSGGKRSLMSSALSRLFFFSDLMWKRCIVLHILTFLLMLLSHFSIGRHLKPFQAVDHCEI